MGEEQVWMQRRRAGFVHHAIEEGSGMLRHTLCGIPLPIGRGVQLTLGEARTYGTICRTCQAGEHRGG